jgi:RHO1 GDP-GTP exchange protein 1/2
MPSKGSGARRERGVQDRSMSMSSTPMAVRTLLESPRLNEGRNSPSSGRAIATRRIPIVYPAMLSCVAKAFRDRIQLADRLKDGLTYKDAFDGREAVDKIAYIIKTTDRNLALLLGRALDAQKFFHDVTYDHRLRDGATELYQFRTKLPSPFVSGELHTEDGRNENGRSGKKPSVDLSSFNLHTVADTDIQDKDDMSRPPHTRPRRSSITSDEVPLPSGVFTLLTDCYSPTCSRDQLCYSIACPRRMEQQARLNIKPQPGLRKQISRESLGDVVVSYLTIPYL